MVSLPPTNTPMSLWWMWKKLQQEGKKGPKKFSLKIVTLTPPTLLVAAVAQYIMQQSEIGFVSTRYTLLMPYPYTSARISNLFWIVETLPKKIVFQFILTLILVQTKFYQRNEMEMKQCLKLFFMNTLLLHFTSVDIIKKHWQ